MSIIGAIRCKNEARWIERCVRSLFPLCSAVHVMDDHSTDKTAAICRKIPGVTVLKSPFDGLDEARDKTWLLSQVPSCDWVIWIDGDEELVKSDQLIIEQACQSNRARSYQLRILYLWDRENQIRVDGVYGRFRRPSLFRYRKGASFASTRNGGNFHCSNVPADCLRGSVPLEARLLHYGYLHLEDRLRKWIWYNERDPGNQYEQEYIHSIQGDRPEVPAEARLKWAGPLKLEAI